MARRTWNNCKPGMQAALQRVNDAWRAHMFARARGAGADELAELLAECRAAEAARDALYIDNRPVADPAPGATLQPASRKAADFLANLDK